MKYREFGCVGAALLLAGCASAPAGQSELVGERWFKTPIDTYPVRIESVDGASSTLPVQYVAPGPHRLTVVLETGVIDRTKHHWVNFPANMRHDVLLEYSRLWGNFGDPKVTSAPA